MKTTGKTIHSRTHKLYWQCQLGGWGAVSIFWLYIALFRDNYEIPHALFNYLLDLSICIALTHAYRVLALHGKWNELNIKKLIWKVIPALIILSVLFMVFMNLKMSSFHYLVNGKNHFLRNTLVWNPVLITGLRHMSIWLLAYHLYHFYQREVLTAQMNAQLTLVAKQAQFANLSAQLNPHFLFNSLNSIKALIIENPKTARRAVDLLSDILRSSLYDKRQTTVALEDEMALVKDYLELEKLRFEERLRITIEVDQQLNNIQILPFSIQLLAENALKHGIDKQLEGGELYISATKNINKAVIVIKNPGEFRATNNKGLGLKNLKDRLQLKYKAEAQLKVEEIAHETVLATLTLPIITP